MLPTRRTTSNDKADVNSTPATPSVVASTTINTNAPVDWLQHAHFPRELRNKIYDYALPSEITIHNVVVTSEVAKLLSIDRPSRREFLEKVRLTRHYTLEYTSNTALFHSLTSLPAGSFAPYRHLTITAVGAYNGHSNTHGGNGFHRTNIAPTLFREGDGISFEMQFACSNCWTEDFYRQELWFALPLVLPEFVRVSGMNLQGGVRVQINMRVRRLSGTAHLVPSYDVNEIWQPWKTLILARLNVGFARDRLDHCCPYGDAIEHDYARRMTVMRELTGVQGQRVGYLILQ